MLLLLTESLRAIPNEALGCYLVGAPLACTVVMVPGGREHNQDQLAELMHAGNPEATGQESPVDDLAHVRCLMNNVLNAVHQQLHHVSPIVMGIPLTPLHVLHRTHSTASRPSLLTVTGLTISSWG